MATAKVRKGRIIERNPAVILDHVVGLGGDAITPDQIAEISVTVFDQQSQEQIGTALDIDPTEAITDELVSGDSRWHQDADGFNVTITIPGSYFPDRSNYRAEILFTPVEDEYGSGGEPFRVLWDLQAINVLSA